jgi:hypothetical protein
MRWGFRRALVVVVAVCAVLVPTSVAAVGAEPVGYRPSPAVAEVDHPLIYSNGCHLGDTDMVPRACTFAQPQGRHTLALFGDSHAAEWFGALLPIATLRGWRMLSITKTHCPADDVAVARYLSTERYPECPTWRRRVFAEIAKGTWGHIDVLVIGSWQFHTIFTKATGPAIVAPDRIATWEAGERRTLKALSPYVGRIVVLRDTPDMPVSKPAFNACMRGHFNTPNICGSTWARTMSDDIWHAQIRAGTGLPNVTYANLTTALCPDLKCPTVLYGIRIYKDDNHLTQYFMRQIMAPRLRALLDREMRKAVAISVV